MKHLVVLVVLLGACGDAAATPGDLSSITVALITVPAPDAVIVEVHIGGGLCVDGLCSTTYTAYGDGRVQLNGVDESVIDAPSLSALLGDLAGGAGELPPFTGTCPEAYDGPRYTYRFDGTEIDSCVSDVSDSNLIRLIHSSLRLGFPYGERSPETV
jgi:hypothetical protein